MKRWLPFCVGIVAVVVASLVPVSAAPSPAQDAHAFSDTLWHAVTYFVLTSLGLYSVSEREGRVYVFVALSVILFGAGVEIAQSFVPYRTASSTDTVANAVGTSLALVVALYATRESEGFLSRKRSLDRE